MTVELRPMGVACNLGCTYCYQEPMREAGNIHTKYDIDLMLEKAEETGQQFSLFGGEILLLPKKDLEKFLKRSFELHGCSNLQSNGTLIDDDHIELFKKYKTHVGISIDGPNDLNDLRVVRAKKNDVNKTREFTKKTMDNLQKLASNKIDCGIIITLHRLNGTKENLPRLMNFMRWLGDIGIKGGNIHTLEVDKTMPDQSKYVLTQEENAHAFITIAEFLKENTDLIYNPFRDIENVISGNDKSINCTWKKCDPMNTQAVYGIEGNGGLSNCGRTNKEGIDWYKADDFGFERYISLYHTPQEFGGCQGCRFFTICGGSCPGEGMDYDFRNKTIHCYTQKKILGYYEEKVEKEGKIPFSKRPDLKLIEKIMVDSLKNNDVRSFDCIIDEINKNKVKYAKVIEVK